MTIAIFTEDKNIFLNILRNFENSNNFNKNNIKLLSTSELENKEMSFKNDILTIQNINSYNDFNNTNIVIFCVRNELTEKYVYDFIENNCIVLDGSSYFVNDTVIPTIDYNIDTANIKKYEYKNVIKLPSQSTLQLTGILNIFKTINKINKVVVSTYQSASSVSKNAMDELFLHTKKIYENSFLPQVHFKKQISFNVLPQVGGIGKNGYYQEEVRIIEETKEIIDKNLQIAVTCAMVPVFNGNCQSVNIEFENDFELNDIYDLFEKNEDTVTVLDRFEEFNFATPKEIAMESTIFISRIRQGYSDKKSLNIWTVADNLTLYTNNILNIVNFLLAK